MRCLIFENILVDHWVVIVFKSQSTSFKKILNFIWITNGTFLQKLCCLYLCVRVSPMNLLIQFSNSVDILIQIDPIQSPQVRITFTKIALMPRLLATLANQWLMFEPNQLIQLLLIVIAFLLMLAKLAPKWFFENFTATPPLLTWVLRLMGAARPVEVIILSKLFITLFTNQEIKLDIFVSF